MQNDNTECMALLVKNGAAINTDKQLYHAAGKGDVGDMERLIDQGVNVNCTPDGVNVFAVVPAVPPSFFFCMFRFLTGLHLSL